jgi:hypothetical protein
MYVQTNWRNWESSSPFIADAQKLIENFVLKVYKVQGGPVTKIEKFQDEASTRIPR